MEEDAPGCLQPGGDDDPWRRMLLPACREVVTTIALKDDAPGSLLPGGEDAPLRTMLRGLGTARGGEDVTGVPPVRNPGGTPRGVPIASR